MGLCILLAVLQLVSLNDGFEFSCPSKAHWRLRAKSMCKPPDNYTCLYDVTLQVNEYRDRCYRPRILASGYKYVFQPNLNRATCSLTRYQPIIFETIGNSDCIFLKSFCNSEGQMTYENGSTKSDRTCVCNSYKGFAFLNNTKNEIYCNPSNEDCSCYLSIQPNSTTIGDLKNHDEINLHQSHSQGNFLSKLQAFKNNDLDNLKYNLAFPTKKYRIVAAVCIKVSLFLYILVAIGIYKVITRTLTNTPKAFEIVDCTDHSITVEWNIHDLDNCLEYELVYRREGSDEWKNKFLSKKDVTVNDNGRYVYKLQNLSSDSSYELKLCSVDIHQVKSQPSRLQTRKTLKIALPQVIKQLPEEDRIRYVKLMEDSATERRYFARIMIVGKEGVGKTCLLRRLLNESIEDVTSTDGVDIVVHRCKINIHDGEWTIEKDITDDNVHRMQKALAQIQSKENEKHEKFNTCHVIASYNGSGMDVQDGNQNNTINNGYTTEESSPNVHKKSSDADHTKHIINNVDTTDESNPNVHKLCIGADDTNNTMNNVETTDESNLNVHKLCTDADDTNNTKNNVDTTDESNPNVHKLCTDADDTNNTMNNVDTTYESNPNVHKVSTDADDTKNLINNQHITDESNLNVNKVSTDANDTKHTINNVDTTDESNPNVHKLCIDADDTKHTINNVDTTDESNPNVHKLCTGADDTNNTMNNVVTTDESNLNVHKVSTDADDTKNTINNQHITDEINPNVNKVSTDANDTKNTINNVDTTDESNPNVHKVSTDADDTNKTINNELTTEESNPNVHKVSTDASDTKNTIETSVEINMKVNESALNVKDNEYENITNTDTDSTKSENEDNLSSLEMPKDLMSQIFASTSTSSIPSNDYALCGLWDFAGQKDFYATHQVFLTSSAIYLVVADMETDIWKEKEDDSKESTSAKQEIAHFLTDDGEYVDYWFDSIHCYRTASLSGEEHLNTSFDPPAIVVFTGTDRYDQENLNKRKQELKNQLYTVIGNQTKYQHFRKYFYLSNKQKSTEEFGKLRDTISEIAKNMESWGESVPLKWILLEQLIENNRKKGKHFIKFNDMVKLAKHQEIKISDTDELKLFLRIQGKVGNIIYFEDITNLIILEPQWLVNAFRCLVSDKLDINSLNDKRKPICSHWTELQTTGKISNFLITTLFELKGGDQALEQKDDLIKVMKKFDILVEIEGTDTYIMPSKMPSSDLKTVCKTIGVCTESCERTSWFCLKFEFLPPVFFNHLSAWLIKQYRPFKLTGGSSSLSLYKEVCVFNFDNSGCDKLLMTMSTDTIALQVVSFDTKKKDLSDLCSNVRIDLENKIEDIKQRYSLELFYVKRFQCSDGNYEINAISLEDLKTQDSFYCLHHKSVHESKMIYSPWTKHERKMNDAQPIGDGIFDLLCNVENLKEEELLPKMQEIAAALKAIKDYDRGKGWKLVKSIANTLESDSSITYKIGHVLHQQQFAETAMKMLTSIDMKSIFITEENVLTVRHTLAALRNFSDVCLEFAKSVAQHGGVKYLTDICNMCKHKPDNLSTEDVFFVVKSSLGILHNIARNFNAKHYFKESATLDVILQFLQSEEENEIVKITAMLTLAHSIEEEENDRLIDRTGAVEGIVSYIKLALDKKQRRYNGFTPIELMDGLDKLSVNDINKRKIVDAGALPLILRMLKQDNIEEQAVASKALWTLSFDKDVAQKLRDIEDIMPTLEKLSGSQDKKVEINCKRALSVLKGQNDVKNHSTVGSQ